MCVGSVSMDGFFSFCLLGLLVQYSIVRTSVGRERGRGRETYMENSDTCHVHEYMSRLGMCIVCMHALLLCVHVTCGAQCVPSVLTVALPTLAHVWTATD